MGLFWDLVQQSQIGQQRERAATLDLRVSALEREVLQTRRLLVLLIERLEKHFGEDIDQDGRVG